MTVLNAAGRDIEEVPLVSMLNHWLSCLSVRQAIERHKLVTLTAEDHQGLATKTLSKARAAFLIRRILFHEPTLRLVARIIHARMGQDYLPTVAELRTLRTELKGLAHASQAGLVLPSDPNLPAVPGATASGPLVKLT